jgi:tetratricopeptide (TPR) repeat protein
MYCCLAPTPVLAGEAEWEQYNTEGANAYQAASFGQAEKYFKLALKEAEKFGDRDLRLASSLTNLGVLYNFRALPAKAEPLFERSVAIKLRVLGPDNAEVIAATGKLCQFYLRNGNHSKADPLCLKILAYANNIVKDRQQIAASFSKLSDFYQKHVELEQAEILVKQAQNLTEKSAADTDLDLATLLDALGGSFTGTDRHEIAEQLYDHALSLRLNSLSPNHIALASSYENLAKLYMLESRYAQAEPLFYKSMQISRTVLGEQKPETLARVEGLAQCYIKLGRSADAESLYAHTLGVIEKAYGNSSSYGANTQVSLGSLMARQGRYKEAANMLSQALKTNEKLNGPQHASLSPLLDSYADALDKTNRHAEAAKAKARAKAIRG